MPQANLYIWTREPHPPHWLDGASAWSHIDTLPLGESHYEHRYICLEADEAARRSALLSEWLKSIRRWGHPLLWQGSTAPVRHLVSDLDGTLTAREGMVELARVRGRERELEELTSAAMLGQEPFAESFIARTALLEGITWEQMAEVARQLPLSPGATGLARLCQGRGISFGVATGAYAPLARVLQSRLGYDRYIASSPSLDEGGRLVGIEPKAIVQGEHKRSFALAQGLPLRTLCVGDGANDLPMLSEAGYALLYPAATGYAASLPPIDLLVERIVCTPLLGLGAIDAHSKQ